MISVSKSRPLRLIFIANLVSMIGSGMNGAAVTWFILQATHSEMALGTLVVLQTIPAMLILPFSGVIIDREDRRRLVMFLDASRALVILAIAVLALMHRVHVWQLYLMSILVTAGFWMFWPTITALIQELTPEAEFVHSNSFLLAGVQTGWLLAGGLVGFVYNHIGLGGVLLLDVSSYVFSFSCYMFVRKGRHVVQPAHTVQHDIEVAENAVARFWHDVSEGLGFVRANPYVILVGVSWALFTCAMMCQGILTAPLSDKALRAGAVGYGWLNASWAIGAAASVAYSAQVIRSNQARRTIAVTMGMLATCLFLLPWIPRMVSPDVRWPFWFGPYVSHFSPVLALAAITYCIMGSGRGVGGVAISTTMMETVPKHFMGRVQNTIYLLSTVLQIGFGFAVGAAAQRALAFGFALVGSLYLMSSIAALVPHRGSTEVVTDQAPVETLAD
jgi:hypothetical protein